MAMKHYMVCVSVYFLYLADIGSTSILTLLTQTEQLIECFTASTHIIEGPCLPSAFFHPPQLSADQPHWYNFTLSWLMAKWNCPFTALLSSLIHVVTLLRWIIFLSTPLLLSFLACQLLLRIAGNWNCLKTWQMVTGLQLLFLKMLNNDFQMRNFCFDFVSNWLGLAFT